MRMTNVDGTSEDVAFEISDIAWADGEEQPPVNLGDGAVEVVLVELKD